jgi:hypothetical protein
METSNFTEQKRIPFDVGGDFGTVTGNFQSGTCE